MAISRRQAHRHPDLAGDCVHDDDQPSTNWPIALYVLFLAVALLLGGYLLIAAIGALGDLVK